jgi:hypothetical protein
MSQCCKLRQYDSAIRYRMSPSFYVAMDKLIARASSPADTGGENEAYDLKQRKYFMGSRISLDVPTGTDMTTPMRKALGSYMTYFASYCPGSGFRGSWNCLGPFQSPPSLRFFAGLGGGSVMPLN